MAYLITHHDKFHVHAFLGFFCLFNYLYRSLLHIVYGSVFLDKSNAWYIIGMYIFLSLSSLQFVIPSSRVKGQRPMIWREYRAHSIVFSLRHFLSTLVIIYLDQYKYQEHILISLIFLTMGAADLCTYLYKDDASHTIRRMPYPQDTDQSEKDIMREFYSSSQFGATISGLCNLDLAYLFCIPIQLGAFLMTLERKAKISPKTWHIYYGLSISLCFLVNIFTSFHTNEISNLVFTAFAMNIGFKLRMDGINKYIVWALVISFIETYKYYQINLVSFNYLIPVFSVLYNFKIFHTIYSLKN